MIERQVTFQVLPGREQTFVEFFFREYRPAMARSSGFVQAELLRDIDNQLKHTMILRFESVEDAAGWRASGEHEALKPTLKSLYEVNELKVFEVIQETMNDGETN